MEKEQLIKRLNEIAELSSGDPEVAHSQADDLLIEYIGDEKVKEAFENIDKWYA